MMALKNSFLLIFDLIPPSEKEFVEMDIAEKSEIMNKLGFNCEHIEVIDISQGMSDKFFFDSECGSVAKDMLGEIIGHNNKNGISNLVYVNTHWAAKGLVDKHPEWMQRTLDGHIIKAGYGDGALFCTNSAFRDWIKILIKNIARYDIDGIFLDGSMVHESGCFCEACKKKFKEEYGYELDEDIYSNNEKHQAYLEYKSDSIAKFLVLCNKTLKKIKPDSIIYMNGLTVTANLYCSRDNNLLVSHQDMLGAEGGFLYGDIRETTVLKPGIVAKYIETQANGKPTVVFSAGRWSGWKRNLLTGPEHWILFAESAANGANIWYGIYTENIKDRILNEVKEINDFLTKNIKYYTNTYSLARTAIVWSGKTANFYQSTALKTDYTKKVEKVSDEQKNDAYSDFIGWCEMLSRNHILYDIIDDFAVENKDISKYNTLILPNISCMSKREAGKIEQYVKDGGNIISSFDTSAYNQYGEQIDEMQLKNVMGILQIDGRQKMENDHIKLVESDILKNTVQSFMPAPQLSMKIKPAGGTRRYMFYKERQQCVYSDIMPDTEYPFMIINNFGKGQSVYFTGNIGYMYKKYQIIEYKEIAFNINRYLNDVQIEILNGPSSIDLVYRGWEEKKILHVINYTGEMTRPIEKIIPLMNTHVRIHDTEINKVYDTKREKILDIKRFDKYIEVTLPEIKEYEVYILSSTSQSFVS